MGSISGQGTKIPHTAEQRSLHITTRESMHCNETAHMTQRRNCDPMQPNKQANIFKILTGVPDLKKVKKHYI